MSEVRVGYKMTELGEIPNEWDVLPLKNIINEFLVPMRDKPKKFEGNIPWCRIEDIEGKYLSKSLSNQNVSQDIINEMNLKVIPTGSVICSCSARLGVCAITKNELTTNQTFIALVPSESVNNEYLYYLMTSFAPKLQMMSAGTTIAYLSRKQFEDFLVQLPKVEEQQKIASIFSTVDEQIDEAEQLIVKTKELKKGLMQQLLTKGIGHTEFKQTELGEIPSEWEYVLLDAVAERKSGHTPDKKMNSYWNGNIPWISLKDTYRLDNQYVDKTTDYTTVEGINNSSAVLLPANTVIISRDATVGKVGITKYEMATSQHFINYICGENLNYVFLYYYLLSKKALFQRIAIGSTIKTIGLPFFKEPFFKEFKIILPPLEEQQKIASILSTVDKQIKVYEREKAKFKELKKGLMQQLLTGQIRVKI